MSAGPGEDAPDIRERLVRRSAHDDALRRSLIEDPKATVEREIGVQLPGDLEVRVVEETETTVYLVLPAPDRRAAPARELTDRDLEGVAGAGWTSGATNSGYTCDMDNPQCVVG